MTPGETAEGRRLLAAANHPGNWIPPITDAATALQDWAVNHLPGLLDRIEKLVEALRAAAKSEGAALAEVERLKEDGYCGSCQGPNTSVCGYCA